MQHASSSGSTPRGAADAGGPARVPPLVLAIAGALLIAWAAILVRLADVEPATSAAWRMLLALPMLALLVVLRDRWRRRRGARPEPPLDAHALRWSLAAGAAFAVDIGLWHRAIEQVGAGLATVLANVQVAIVPLAAWALFGERVARRQAGAIPLALVGTGLIAGLVGSDAFGDDPLAGAAFGLGTALAYGAYLLCLRGATRPDRLPVRELAIATATCAVLLVAHGLASGGLDLAPPLAALAWLAVLAAACQVAGWLLIATSLGRLPAGTVALVLPVQPVGSLLLGAVLLAEDPSPWQWAGAALVVAAIVLAAGARGTRGTGRGRPDADGQRVSTPPAG